MDLRTAKSLSPREYHARRAASRGAEREALRQSRLQQARNAIRRLAPDFPAVRRVFLFGSLLCPGRFHAGSDIDVAVECDDLESETPFARALQRELGTFIDLRPLHGAVAEAVRDGGRRSMDEDSLTTKPSIHSTSCVDSDISSGPPTASISTPSAWRSCCARRLPCASFPASNRGLPELPRDSRALKPGETTGLALGQDHAPPRPEPGKVHLDPGFGGLNGGRRISRRSIRRPKRGTKFFGWPDRRP